MKYISTLIVILACASCANMDLAKLNVNGFIRDNNTGAKAGMSNGVPYFKIPVATKGGQTGYIEVSGK